MAGPGFVDILDGAGVGWRGAWSSLSPRAAAALAKVRLTRALQFASLADMGRDELAAMWAQLAPDAADDLEGFIGLVELSASPAALVARQAAPLRQVVFGAAVAAHRPATAAAALSSPRPSWRCRRRRAGWPSATVRWLRAVVEGGPGGGQAAAH